MPVLPEGWKIETRKLEEDLILFPEGDSDIPTNGGEGLEVGTFSCGYTLVWDQYSNNFHRFTTTTGNANLELNYIFNGLTPIDLIYYLLSFTTPFIIGGYFSMYAINVFVSTILKVALMVVTVPVALPLWITWIVMLFV